MLSHWNSKPRRGPLQTVLDVLQRLGNSIGPSGGWDRETQPTTDGTHNWEWRFEQQNRRSI